MKNVMIKKQPTRQQGAVLLVALVFLLILTTLAVTGMREVVLESRITNNLIDQRQLFNAAEAGARDGEYRTIGTLTKIPGSYDIRTALIPIDAKVACDASIAPGTPCLIDTSPTYTQHFDASDADYKGRQVYSPDPNTSFDETIHWYAIPAPSGADIGENENPEYGNMLMGTGIFRYEVNSRATSNSGEARLRTTVSRIYN
ncbi:MAG: PilX N-terminal domain-containing pilus assembly protein [Anaerolineae bacterium]|jgi:type IV pilus assembly protein PilX|nr:PilX N-terminal domain-containing pilus assembly protein [Anaerolineae bacterium]